MPYSRDEVARELRSFYEFLVETHIPSDALKIPPPGGWAEITIEKLGFLKKDDTVIDLLKHIPYIDDDVHTPDYQIYEMTMCNDFIGSRFVKSAIEFQDGDFTGFPSYLRDEDTQKWCQPHIATLARSAQADNGHYLFLNTRDGTLELADWIVGKSRFFDNAKSCFDTLKDEYRQFKVIACDVEDVNFICDDSDYDKYVEIYRKHGWLSQSYNKEECLAELERLYNS